MKAGQRQKLTYKREMCACIYVGKFVCTAKTNMSIFVRPVRAAADTSHERREEQRAFHGLARNQTRVALPAASPHPAPDLDSTSSVPLRSLHDDEFSTDDEDEVSSNTPEFLAEILRNFEVREKQLEERKIELDEKEKNMFEQYEAWENEMLHKATVEPEKLSAFTKIEAAEKQKLQDESMKLQKDLTTCQAEKNELKKNIEEISARTHNVELLSEETIKKIREEIKEEEKLAKEATIKRLEDDKSALEARLRAVERPSTTDDLNAKNATNDDKERQSLLEQIRIKIKEAGDRRKNQITPTNLLNMFKDNGDILASNEIIKYMLNKDGTKSIDWKGMGINGKKTEIQVHYFETKLKELADVKTLNELLDRISKPTYKWK